MAYKLCEDCLYFGICDAVYSDRIFACVYFDKKIPNVNMKRDVSKERREQELIDRLWDEKPWYREKRENGRPGVKQATIRKKKDGV